MKKVLISLLVVGILLSSCAWVGVNMRKVSVGMTRDQVMKEIGQPINVINAKRTDGNLQEIWEYPGGGEARIWVYFENGKVTRWNRTGLY